MKRRAYCVYKKIIGGEIRSLSNLLRRHAENSATFQYAKSVTGANGWIIAYIADNPDKDVFQKDLEEKFSTTRSTISKVIKLMEQKGLIERHGVSDDARLKKLVLTPKALALHQEIMNDIKNTEAILLNGFTQEEIDNLSSYIERMKNNLK
ncbi:MAG TPA: MarR family transcriptional regulator [Clostridiaceae bacterium]|nr:MarR family transcriptional regulator [Clostridiaceae bacterium]